MDKPLLLKIWLEPLILGSFTLGTTERRSPMKNATPSQVQLSTGFFHAKVLPGAVFNSRLLLLTACARDEVMHLRSLGPFMILHAIVKQQPKENAGQKHTTVRSVFLQELASPLNPLLRAGGLSQQPSHKAGTSSEVCCAKAQGLSLHRMCKGPLSSINKANGTKGV